MKHIETITVTVNYYKYSNGELLKTFKREETTYKHVINSLFKIGHKVIIGNSVDEIDVYI